MLNSQAKTAIWCN